VTIEENVVMGGAGSGVNEFMQRERLSVQILNLGLPDYFVQQGQVAELHQLIGLDAEGIKASINKRLKNNA
jgi:1-deoxy-D-xylulose-5-phosphate synthase